jgi:hypothetical protein
VAAAATATQAEASYALTQAYRAQQNRTGALIAVLVSTYYKNLVTVEDPASVARWLEIMVPRILAGSSQTATLASQYATAVRALELPAAPRISFDPSVGAVEAQVRTSLAVVGPTDFMNKARSIEQLDVDPVMKKAMLAEAKQVTADKVAGATLRHVQNGGRQTIADVTRRQDGKALGYVRVTKDKPCFFCAMLASRGLVFAVDSFADSDPRFVGDGTAKVHDHCSCGLKPVYTRQGDKALEAVAPFEDMWNRWGKGQGNDSVKLFRKGYDLWVSDGVIRDLSDFAA